MNTLSATCFCNARILKFPSISSFARNPGTKNILPGNCFRIRASSNEVDTKTEEDSENDVQEQGTAEASKISVGATSTGPAFDKEIKKAIPSLRARDCSKNEKEALNYLFLLIRLLNVIIPFFWKSFAVVWSADTVAFLGMYAWKLGWLQQSE